MTPPVITAVCLEESCENTFVPNRRGRPRMYCHEHSTKAAYSRRSKAGITLPPNPCVRRLPREATCERCGGTYTKTFGPQRYCGQPGCSEFVAATCDGCGKPFQARTRDRAKG